MARPWRVKGASLVDAKKEVSFGDESARSDPSSSNQQACFE